ncbi:hypothetical protein ALQ15_200122 [Pseudomonas syringae pv. actinidiae]|uniref:Uncharacterized protein n=1 Tax=Pseudomonas syringae pv. actinidiae TaxID=103796 RepID=A0A7Z6UD69_PSESF|nr:hypothetical protein ALQ15_200122 [Pseudomonas syringae pv. actinidiae]
MRLPPQKENPSASWNSISSTWRVPTVLVSINSGLLPEKRSFGLVIRVALQRFESRETKKPELGLPDSGIFSLQISQVRWDQTIPQTFTCRPLRLRCSIFFHYRTPVCGSAV